MDNGGVYYPIIAAVNFLSLVAASTINLHETWNMIHARSKMLLTRLPVLCEKICMKQVDFHVGFYFVSIVVAIFCISSNFQGVMDVVRYFLSACDHRLLPNLDSLTMSNINRITNELDGHQYWWIDIIFPASTQIDRTLGSFRFCVWKQYFGWLKREMFLS